MEMQIAPDSVSQQIYFDILQKCHSQLNNHAFGFGEDVIVFRMKVNFIYILLHNTIHACLRNRIVTGMTGCSRTQSI